MNLAAVDLNLLLVFDALMIERNVTRAGNRVCLSQPAVSAALNRLRHLTGDDLFIRRTDGMLPTARALALEEPVRRALQQISSALEPPCFTPADSERSFHIALNDLGATMIMPHLAARLGSDAPKVDITVEHADGEQALHLLEAGKIDLALGLIDDPGSRFCSEKLYDIPCSCAMRRDHPLLAGALSVKRFVATPQLAIAQDGGMGRIIDRSLDEHRLRRRIAMTMPHFLAGLFVLGHTDLIAVLPDKLIKRFGPAAGIVGVPIPFATVQIASTLVWNRQTDASPPHDWLRRVLVQICEQHHLDRWE
jgi:DNA-binding transcriptional LysR family regulator